MGRRKSQKIIRTGPKNATTGMCPLCQTIGKIFLLGSPGEERAKCENAVKNLNYNPKLLIPNQSIHP